MYNVKVKLIRLFNSIFFRVLALFIGFTLGMIVFLYVNQVILLPLYYNNTKTQESVLTMNRLQSDWGTDAFNSTIDNLARRYEMRIEVIVFDRLGNQSLYFVDPENRFVSIFNEEDNSSIIWNVMNSPDGIYSIQSAVGDDNSRQFLTMVSYLGEKSSIEGYVAVYNYIQPMANMVELLQSQYYANAFLLVTVAVMLSVILSIVISRPIKKISAAAKTIPSGNFGIKPSISDYTEIRLLEANLAIASREVAKSEKLRKDLIANVSHDLKTPLTMIKAYAEMIRDLSGNNPEKRNYHLGVIIEEADRLNNLVVDMLDISKLQSGAIEIHSSGFNFSEHLESVVRRYDLLSDERNYNLQSEIQNGIRINADVSKIEQVVYNLINNAINYTGDDGSVTVRLFRRKGKARFEVTDTGIGIKAEEIPLIWERYYKANKSENHHRTTKGTGLGLSIVKGILEGHSFPYGVDSEVGKGSTFWFEVPSEYVLPDAPDSKKPSSTPEIKKQPPPPENKKP
jgi:signal transduction histidine kinase